MGNTDDKMLRLLREIADIAEESSLTGALQGGAPQAVTRYNAILRYFIAEEKIPDGLFSPLPETTGFAQVGVESRMLYAFFTNDKGKSSSKGGVDGSLLIRLAPFVDSRDLAELVQEYTREGVGLDPGTLTALAPFLDSNSLGSLIRSHLGKIKGARSADEGDQPKPPASPAPTPKLPVPSGDLVPFNASPVRHTLEELAARLRENNLTSEERQRIAMALAEIAHEQARG